MSKIFIFLTVNILFINQQAIAQDTYWRGSCTEQNTTQVFKIKSQQPFLKCEYGYDENIKASIKLTFQSNLDYDPLFKTAAKCAYYSEVNREFGEPDKISQVLCINSKIAAYEFPILGNATTSINKLKEKYGKIIKETKNTWFKDAPATYSLFEKQSENYVVLIQTARKTLSGTKTYYSVVYLNPSSIHSLIDDYSKAISEETTRDQNRKSISTKEDLEKIK